MNVWKLTCLVNIFIISTSGIVVGELETALM